MNQRIVRRERRDAVDGIEQLNPLLQRVYSARNIESVEDVQYDLNSLAPFDGLLNIDVAVERLKQALENQERILIVGDFDTDGATSTTLAVRALTAFGAEKVDYIVPNRFEFGYGLTPEIIDHALCDPEKKPDLMITVDNGIASHAGVAHANALGIDVLITDHHLPSDTLPEAVAIVNPNLPGDSFPSRCMAGVGVIFYVMLALRAALRDVGWFVQRGIPCLNMTTLLDLVALGTVADVVPLDKNNRILVHQGLRRIRAGKACPGILSLVQVARRALTQVRASDLSFAVAPRLNAAGRLEDMSFGIACLLSDDMDISLQMAEQLNVLNMERRALETQMREEAYQILETLDLERESSMGLCLYDESWHQGIVGLVAARVKEKTHRPVIVFSKVGENELKGSARSVKGVHVRDVLDEIATQNPDLITKFGGHAMAAGLSLPLQSLETFRDLFNQGVAKRLTPKDLEGVYETDGELEFHEYTLENAQVLQDAGPWGQHFPEPMFDGHFRVIDQRIVGEKHLKLMLQAVGASHYLDAIAFHVDLDVWPNYDCETAHIVYHLDVNCYRDQRRLQLLVEEMWPVAVTEPA